MTITLSAQWSLLGDGQDKEWHTGLILVLQQNHSNLTLLSLFNCSVMILMLQTQEGMEVRKRCIPCLYSCTQISVIFFFKSSLLYMPKPGLEPTT